MNALNQILLLAMLALPVVLAITVHEAAHGWVANRLGDRTAMMLGRVTFNPLRHIDPIGTVLVPLMMYFVTKYMFGAGFLFGWAKPVPVNARNLRNPRKDMAFVALAGPGVNLLMAIAWGLMIQVAVLLGDASLWAAFLLAKMCAAGVLVNVFLMVLNLVPLLPLDGGRVLNALLPPRWSWYFSRLEPYGLLVLMLFLATGLLGRVLLPLVVGVVSVLPNGDLVWRLLPF